MGSLTSALSRASISGVGHLFPWEGVTCFAKSFFPWTWRVLEETRGRPYPLPPLQDSAPAADSKEPPMCSVTRDRLNASRAQGFSCLGLWL